MDELSVEERLEDLPRPGAPSRLNADQLCQIEQMACEAPEKAGRPISQGAFYCPGSSNITFLLVLSTTAAQMVDDQGCRWA